MDRFTHVYKGSPPDHCVCDQALRLLPNGDWAIFFMTGGDHEPRKENYIAVCRSKDHGATWSKPETVLRFDDRACLLSEVIVHGQEIRIMGTSHLGYFEDWRNFVLTSRDNGHTWDEPIPFTHKLRRAFLRNLYISTWGEWFLPFQSYDTVPDATASPLRDGSFKQTRVLCLVLISCVYSKSVDEYKAQTYGVLISSDEGRTWIKSAEIGPTAGWAENNVAEGKGARGLEGKEERSNSYHLAILPSCLLK
ncbi:exo-alpha-sialidase [Candidatus Poribacteria bacterium]|nr:exo-alpha-sialidase [Candidatus Poribacteria bacterium]